MSNERDNSLESLEIKVAFLEDSLAKLSDEFYIQQKEFSDLKQQHSAMLTKLSSGQDGDNSSLDVVDDKPPHY